jgi:hypothetical protein
VNRLELSAELGKASLGANARELVEVILFKRLWHELLLSGRE